MTSSKADDLMQLSKACVCSDQPTGRLALVFELMDMNIYELIRGRSHYVAEERIRRYMYQLIKAMDHMHKAGIFHRYTPHLLTVPSCANHVTYF